MQFSIQILEPVFKIHNYSTDNNNQQYEQKDVYYK